jgi:hypothetical protein
MYLHRCIQIRRLQQQLPITTPPPTRDSQPRLSLSWSPMQVHCNKNPVYVFPVKELRGLSPNFHIYVSVSGL